MKTLAQIRKKVAVLQRKLERTKVSENFGDGEIRALGDFIGDTYEYPYQDRMSINNITEEFSQWCALYTN